MEFELFVIYDAAKNIYSAPMAQYNDADAMRAFAHECMKADSVWNSHPQDFVMYKVGIYNESTGEISAFSKPERICAATDFVKKGRK